MNLLTNLTSGTTIQQAQSNQQTLIQSISTDTIQQSPQSLLQQENLGLLNEPITLKDIQSVNLFNEKETLELSDEELQAHVYRMRRERLGLGAKLISAPKKEEKKPKEKKPREKKSKPMTAQQQDFFNSLDIDI